jgi:small GTP-binding protein
MKVVVVGDTQVGKTCLVARLVTDQFHATGLPTIGAAFQNHIITTSKGAVTLQIWDTAGQEKYRALTPMYYRNARAALVVFDVTNHQSFQALEEWITDLDSNPDSVTLFLVGNKCDLEDDRVVTTNMAKDWADQHEAVTYVETSAKTGMGVIDLFTRVAECVVSDAAFAEELPRRPDDDGKRKCKC